MSKQLLFLFISGILSARLIFKISETYDGFNLEKPKKKHAVSDFGEDSTVATRQSLIVADGVGQCAFSSKFLSKVLVDSTAKVNIEIEKTEQSAPFNFAGYRERLLKEIDTRLGKFWKLIQNTWEMNLLQQKMKEDDHPLSDFGLSSTLVTAVLDSGSKAVDNLKIFQKGDSLVAVFRLTDSLNGKGKHYQFAYLSPELQKEFGQPIQFVGVPAGVNFKDDISTTETVQKGDIVMLGSDGLFDNIHPSVLLFCVNELVRLLIEGGPAAEVGEGTFLPLADALIEKFKAESSDIVDAVQQEYVPKAMSDLLKAISNGALRVVSPSQKNNAIAAKIGGGIDLSLMHSKMYGATASDNMNTGDNAEAIQALLKSRQVYDAPTNEPVADSFHNAPGSRGRAKLVPLNSIPMGESPDDQEDFWKNHIEEDEVQVSPINQLLTVNSEVTPNDQSAFGRQNTDKDLNINRQNTFDQRLNRDVEIWADEDQEFDDFGAFLHNIDSRDLMYFKNGKRADGPLVSGRVELFMSRRFSFNQNQLNHFYELYDPTAFGSALAHMAYKFSYEPEYYPAPFWLNAISWQIYDEEPLGKPDDISLVAGLVITSDMKFNAIDPERALQSVNEDEDYYTLLLKQSIATFMKATEKKVII